MYIFDILNEIIPNHSIFIYLYIHNYQLEQTTIQAYILYISN